MYNSRYKAKSHPTNKLNSNLKQLKQNALSILKKRKWTDCSFLVGNDPSNQKIVAGHKLILAMSSEVFERMFYGEFLEKQDPIVIPDIQPDAFQAMVECIYSDYVLITSFENACGLCYAANKYMLPHIVEECVVYLTENLSPKYACQTYEFAKLLDKKSLVKSSMKLIATHTQMVLTNPSLKEIEIPTLMDILDQNDLNISELDLFNAIILFANYNGELRYGTVEIQIRANEKEFRAFGYSSYNAKCEYYENCLYYKAPSSNLEVERSDTSNSDTSDSEESTSSDLSTVSNQSTPLPAPSSVPKEQPTSPVAASTAANLNSIDAHRLVIDETMLKNAIKKIRFLTMTPQEFAEVPARSTLLQIDEAFAVLMNISSPNIKEYFMPEGFCTSRIKRR